jgi:hypothetical protein
MKNCTIIYQIQTECFEDRNKTITEPILSQLGRNKSGEFFSMLFARFAFFAYFYWFLYVKIFEDLPDQHHGPFF